MNSGTREQSNVLTLILIGARLGTVSFQIARRSLIVAAGAAAVCIVLAGYGLFRITETGKMLSADTLVQMQKASRAELERQQAENATLRERLRRLENQFISIGPKPSQEAAKSVATSAQVTDLVVDRFRMRYRDGGIHFQFDLKTVLQKKGKTSGYIFVVLPPDRSYPAATLQNGKPGNARAGDHFTILRQKNITCMIPNISDPKRYQRAEILIYSEEGVLVYHNAFSSKDL